MKRDKDADKGSGGGAGEGKIPKSRFSKKKVILKDRYHDCSVGNVFFFKNIFFINHMCTNAPQLNRGLSLLIKLHYMSDTRRPVAEAG